MTIAQIFSELREKPPARDGRGVPLSQAQQIQAEEHSRKERWLERMLR